LSLKTKVDGLVSKLAATVSPGLVSKPVATISFDLATKLRFGDFDLKITVTVYWFAPQNQAGHSLPVAP
jgi:hypothetical protein